MLVLVYCVIGIALFYLQDYFLFHPIVLARDYQYRFNIPSREVDIPFNETDTLNMVQFFPADSLRKGIVIYFHGNKGNINRYAKFASDFTRQGYEVWMEDYPGFGKTVGDRNEKVLYRQAEQVYKMAASKYKKDSIIVYGKSFGTGIAAYIASVYDCKQLILETPYYSMTSMTQHYVPIYPASLMRYSFPVNKYLQNIKVPVTIFHGTSDEVIPYKQSVKVKEEFNNINQYL